MKLSIVQDDEKRKQLENVQTYAQRIRFIEVTVFSTVVASTYKVVFTQWRKSLQAREF